MFATDTELYPDRAEAELYEAQINYILRPNDYIELQVFTNSGERIIDPDFQLLQGAGQAMNLRPNPQYLIQPDGNVRLPQLDTIALAGYKVYEAEVKLQELYSEYYEDPYVKLMYVNKRVIVLGAPGGKVIPLVNENMNLLEVLALAGGIDQNAKAYNVRLIRGDLSNPEVQIIDLSTIEGMRRANLQVYSGDIVYVEPVRRTFFVGLRDAATIVTIVTNGIALTVAVISLLPQTTGG